MEKVGIKKGDIYYLQKKDDEVVGCEQDGSRPIVVVSNNMNNKYSTVIEYVNLTTQKKKPLPTHVRIDSAREPSTALCEQIHSASTERLGEFWGRLSRREMDDINEALKVSLGL